MNSKMWKYALRNSASNGSYYTEHVSGFEHCWFLGCMVLHLHSRSCSRGSFCGSFLMWMCVSYSPMNKFWMPLRIRSQSLLKPDLPALVKNTALLQTAQL